ncbi:MAG: TldD/PmbA family protein [Methanocorpusculum parvum]|nr:TldD/PmbA family protein [Methanocorpusculum parvum]
MSEIDIDAILRQGKSLADEVEVYVSRYEDLSLEQRQMAVSSVFEHAGQNIYIRVVKDGKIGVSATSDPTRIADCMKAAVSSANLSDAIAGWDGLSRKTEIANGPDPFDESLEISADVASEYLERMNAGAETYKEARVVTAGVTLLKGASILANSNGVWLERKFTDISLGIDAICEGSTGYDGDSAPFASRLNPEKIGEQTAFYATASRGGEMIESKKYDVVFSENVVDSLVLELFSDAVNGRNVITGKSIYANALGEMVANPKISLTDSPMAEAGDSWRRFDTEGTPTKQFDIVRDGVLTSFLYDKKTAAQAKTQTTGNALRAGNGTTTISPHCLTISAPTEDVLSRPCLFVKEVIGAHTANPLTGEFSVEVANAFLAEGGKLLRPVKKAMLAGNVFDILKGDITISETAKAFSGALVPQMRIPDLQVI